MRRLSNGKSPGPGGIHGELLKYAGPGAIRALTCFLDEREKLIPTKIKESYITNIFKKGNKSDCRNYRGIRVMHGFTGVLSSIIYARIAEECQESEEQNGFSPGRSCTDNVFILRQISEKFSARNEELYMVFIDLSMEQGLIAR